MSPRWAFLRLDFVHVSLQIWNIAIAYDRDFTLGGFAGEFHSPQGNSQRKVGHSDAAVFSNSSRLQVANLQSQPAFAYIM